MPVHDGNCEGHIMTCQETRQIIRDHSFRWQIFPNSACQFA